MHDIRYSDITMTNVRRPFDINMLYHGNDPTPWGDVGPRRSLSEMRRRSAPELPRHPRHEPHRHPLARRWPDLGLPEQMARDITFTNVTIDSIRSFLVAGRQQRRLPQTT